MVTLVALGAELRATGLEEAHFDAVWNYIDRKMRVAPTINGVNTKKFMRLLAPQHTGELLEVGR